MPISSGSQPKISVRIESACDVQSLADALKAGRTEINQIASRPDAAGLVIARMHSDLVDTIVRRMFAISSEKAQQVHKAPIPPISVVATGGYGRRQLSPHSDIDITFIPHHDGDPAADRVIKEMFSQLMRVFMDLSGMEVGYAYRLMEDCGRLDHQTCTGLLDGRLVAGSERIFIQFEQEFLTNFNPADFIFTKLFERRQLRDKCGFTPRVVEPNLKEGPGGLRDIQTAIWLTQARAGLCASQVRDARAWEALQREGGATAAEAHKLAEGLEFLYRVRNALHICADGKRDELVVTRQEEVAALIGYTRSNSQGLPPVEVFMRHLYERLADNFRICNRIMERAENSRLFLGIGLDCKRKCIVPANDALGTDDPMWMLWACELAQRYGLELSEQLERSILDLLQTNPIISESARAGELLARLLASTGGAYPILQLMADIGILNWLIPEFGAVMNLIPYDPSHEYTIGQHTLEVVRHLDSLRRPDEREEMREYRLLMSDLRHPERLYLAALLHDAGKFDASRPHSETGENLARSVCSRLGWSTEAADDVAFLVRHHLLMSETSRLRDLNLDETIREFVSVVTDVDRLHMLYMLTYADTNAVGTGIWSQVKARFQRDLLLRSERTLAGEDFESEESESLSRTRRRLVKELSVGNIPETETAEHIESMPATYLLNTSMEEMSLHIGFVRRARSGEPVVDFHDDRDSTFTAVTVCTLDDPQPGLLSKITGVFYAADLDVHSAQVFTRITYPNPENEKVAERIAIDNFYVDFRGRQLTPGKRKEVADGLTSVLKGTTTLEALITKRRKRTEVGSPVINLKVHNDLSSTFTIIEVTADEERGMFYRISGALSSLCWDIKSARVSGFRGKSIGVFYVTGLRKLTDAEILSRLERLLPIHPVE